MEIPNEEVGLDDQEMAIPLNSSYSGGHGHMIHHHHHPNNIPNDPPISENDHTTPFTKKATTIIIKYKECLKNHAAAMGGNATDGCGEFMPSGDENTLEALTCSACNCHRNFHRKEIEGDVATDNTICSYNPRIGRKIFVGHNHKGYFGQDSLGYPIISSRAVGPPPHHHHPMIMSYNNNNNMGPSESDEHEDGVGVRGPHQNMVMKKRFRTKFSAEQKEKMLSFAERVGWKIQKQEESVVQQFCQEVGVKRRVLKVWMHNNKLNYAKKNNGNINVIHSDIPQKPSLETSSGVI